jgi:hypothetical protein
MNGEAAALLGRISVDLKEMISAVNLPRQHDDPFDRRGVRSSAGLRRRDAASPAGGTPARRSTFPLTFLPARGIVIRLIRSRESGGDPWK